VKHKFCAFVMRECLDIVSKLELPQDLKDKVLNAINDVLRLHEDAVNTGSWDKDKAEAAARAAARAARAEAWAAEASAAATVAAARAAEESAAWASSEAVKGAARAAAWAATAAAEAARAAAYEKYANELLRLLKEESSC
jgi:hypothetical protein